MVSRRDSPVRMVLPDAARTIPLHDRCAVAGRCRPIESLAVEPMPEVRE